MGPTGGNPPNVEKVDRFSNNRIDKWCSVRFLTDSSTSGQQYTANEASYSHGGNGENGSRCCFDRGGIQGGH